MVTVSASLDSNSLDVEDEEVDGVVPASEGPVARFAFVNLNSDGSVSFTFNATSLQYALLAALTALVLASILLPLLGLIGVGSSEPDYSYAYTDQSGYSGSSYDVPPPAYGAPSYGGSSYSKRLFTFINMWYIINDLIVDEMLSRSLSWMGPIMEALSKTYKKYEKRSSRSQENDEE